MKSKTLVITFLTSSLLLGAIFFATLYVYDPLKIFHKPWIYKEYLQHNMRQQAAGIINNFEFDSIILGTSMSENTSSKEASKLLGGRFINISIAGSDFFERAIVLNYVLKKKNIKKVLYSLDSFGGLVYPRKGHPAYHLNDWSYLYDNNPLNDFRAYINNRYLKCLFSISSKKKCMGKKVDFDKPNSWEHVHSSLIRFGGLNNWNARTFNVILKETNQTIKDDKNLKKLILKSHQYIDNTLIKFVEKYPDTEFILFLPPHSRIKYAIKAQYNIPYFERYKANIRYLVNKSNHYSNLKIYGWGNNSFADHIENYRDLNHYASKINSFMLKAISKEEGLLTNNNIDNYLDDFTKKAVKYNLYELKAKVKDYLYNKNQ